MNQSNSVSEKKSKKKRIKQGNLIKQLSLVVLHQGVVFSLKTFNTSDYKPIRKASNTEIGKFYIIFNLGLNVDGHPFIIPKDVTKTRIIHFRDQRGENPVTRKV